MNQNKLDAIIASHQKWLNGEDDGKRANLCGADLQGAILQGADLRDADLQGAILQGAYLEGADLTRAILEGADLWRAILRGAILYGANIDYSTWPLHCGSIGVVVDRRIAAQLAYHFCAVVCDDPDYIAARNAILDFANTFHRVAECGILKPIPQRKED